MNWTVCALILVRILFLIISRYSTGLDWILFLINAGVVIAFLINLIFAAGLYIYVMRFMVL